MVLRIGYRDGRISRDRGEAHSPQAALGKYVVSTSPTGSVPRRRCTIRRTRTRPPNRPENSKPQYPDRIMKPQRLSHGQARAPHTETK